MAELSRDLTADELAGLDPFVRELAVDIISSSRQAGWPVVIHRLGGRRSSADQRRLYAMGRTAPGPIVTHTLTSRHLSGRAFDLDLFGYSRQAGLPLWRHLGIWWQGQGGRWGGAWGDYGHFEI